GLAISATGGGAITINGSLRGTTVALTSGGKISTAGSGFLQASTELTLSAATDGISVDTKATSSLEATNNVVGDIRLTQLASPAQTLSIIGSGVVNKASLGNISITNDGASISVSAAGNGVVSSNGAITLAALDFQINGPVNAGAGNVTLENSTAGRQID